MWARRKRTPTSCSKNIFFIKEWLNVIRTKEIADKGRFVPVLRCILKTGIYEWVQTPRSVLPSTRASERTHLWARWVFFHNGSWIMKIICSMFPFVFESPWCKSALMIRCGLSQDDHQGWEFFTSLTQHYLKQIWSLNYSLKWMIETFLNSHYSILCSTVVTNNMFLFGWSSFRGPAVIYAFFFTRALIILATPLLFHLVNICCE